MSRRIPGIPSVDQAIPQAIKDVLMPLKELAEIREGVRIAGIASGNGLGYTDGYLRRNVTLGMLVKLGIITPGQAKEVSQDE